MMAGIGFQLRRLSRQETISALLAAAGHAAVIAAGPWLFTILSLASITLLSERLVGLEALATFRVIVIYAFAVSLVATAPVAIVVTRLVADALWSKRPETVPQLLLGGYGLALATVAVGIGTLLVAFRLPADIGLALAANSALVGLIWIALAFCGAVRDYRGVTLAFLVGLLVALVASVAAAVASLGPAGMAIGFLTGLTVTFLMLTLRVLQTFPHPTSEPWVGMVAIVRASSGYWPLALGALLGTLGVWIDKWVFWAGPSAEEVAGGLLHAPLYDSAMFIASLVMIPSLSSFVVRLETGFFDRYQQYYATISAHGTYGQIEDARRELTGYTLDNLALITVAQAGICAVLVLTAPLIVEMLGLQFRQIAILRYGALGAVFQFVFIAGAAMLLFFDRRMHYLMLQALFLALMVGFSILSLRLGEDYYGVGYFLACTISGAVAFVVADRTFTHLNYLTFIGNNPSVVPSTTSRQRGFRRRAAS